jgi:hypothetical protein
MFLSKIWFILIGLLAGFALLIAFVAPRPADRRIEQMEGQRLDRAQYTAEQVLKNDARRWIDYVAKLGRDANLVDSLDSASRGAGELRVLHETIRNRLRQLVPDRSGIGVESIIAVDKNGRVIARVGDDEGEYGESIAGAEVVADALRGYMSDDVWGSNNRLRRIGAAPVYSKARDRIVGALVVSVETAKRLTDVWKANLDVDVAIVLRKEVLASTLPEALLGELPKVIEEHATEIDTHKRTRALTLQMGNQSMLAVAASFAGEASMQRAYYVLLVQKTPISDPWALLSSTTAEDLSWSKFPWISLPLAILVVLGIGLLLQRLEVEMPLHRLRREIQRLARLEVVKLDDTKFGGELGGIARDVNAAIEHFTHAVPAKSETEKKDIRAILDPQTPMVDRKSFELPTLKEISKPAPPPPSAVAASLFGSPRASVPPPVSATNENNQKPITLPPLVASSLKTDTPQVVTPPVFSPPMPRPPLPVTPTPMASTKNIPTSHETEEEANDDYFMQVFEEYRMTREKCGESNAGLTLEKFRAKLVNNRQQIMSKYNCRSATFTVYVKDGKAAIRAMPVRD